MYVVIILLLVVLQCVSRTRSSAVTERRSGHPCITLLSIIQQNLRHHHLTPDAESAKTLVHAFITSRIDGCNTVLAGLPRTITDRLQHLLNTSAHVVSNTGKFDRGLTHLLHSELHWLDVPQRILHKLGVTVHRCLQGKAPQYLVNCCHPTSDVASDFNLLAATISSYHDIVAARSAVGHSPSPVRWPGMRCLTTSETRRAVPTISGRS